MHPARPLLGYLMVVTAALLFGVNGGVSRVAMGGDLTVETFTTVRITGATVVFALVALAVRPAALRPPSGRPLVLVAALGLVGVAGLQLTYNIAIDGRSTDYSFASSGEPLGVGETDGTRSTYLTESTCKYFGR